MKKLIIMVLVMLMVGALFGAKVVLKNGNVLKGDVRGKSGDYIYLYLETEKSFVGINDIYISTILDYENNDITQKVFQKDDFEDEVNFNNYQDLEDTEISEGLPLIISREKYDLYDYDFNPAMLAIGASLAVLAWDSFADAGDLSDDIKEIEDIGEDSSKLKSKRSRKYVIGSVLTISSLITFRYSFERVQIQASPTSLSLSYKF